MGTVVAVHGTIPGAGATTVVATVGAALAERNHRVALVDATAEGSRIGDVLPIEGDGDVGDALRRGAVLGTVQASGPHGISVFPGSPDTSWGSMRPDAIGDLYDDLRGRFDIVLVDCGSTITPASAPWLGHADDAIVVTDPDVAGAVEETAALARAFDVPVTGIVANRVPPKEVEAALTALEATGLAILAVLPEDRSVGAAEAAHESVFAHDPDSPMASVAWAFADALLSGDHERPAVPRGTVREVADDPAESTDAHSTDQQSTDQQSSDRQSSDGGTSSTGSEPPDTESGPMDPESEPTAASSTDRAATEEPDPQPEQPTGTAVGSPDEQGSHSSEVERDASDVEREQTRSRISAGAVADASGSGATEERDAGRPPPERAGDSTGESEDAGADDHGPKRFEFDTEPQPVDDDTSAKDAEEAANDGGDPGSDSEKWTDAEAGGSTDGETGRAELSDEEIEAVFQETMERVTKRKEEEADDE